MFLAACLAGLAGTGCAQAQPRPSPLQNLSPESQLRAAQAAADEGDMDRAEDLLNRIAPGTLEPSQLPLAQLLRAQILLARDQPAQALKQLPPDAGHAPQLGAQIEWLRAQALSRLGDGAARIATGLPQAVMTAPAQPAMLNWRGGSGNIALLLPLTGQFSATAEAVRDGFLSAYFRKNDARAPVRIYDAGTGVSTTIAAYQQALNDGAGFIVGPLRKESVSALAGLGQPPVPVLALNYLEGVQAPFNLFQFGLAPEDEARAAAERAVAAGGRRAVVFVPHSDWGERALAAFTQRLQELGGSVLKSARYELGALDFSQPIQELLNIDASESRHNVLTNTLGRKTEFEPRRRDDVDFIFIAARPSEGRLIWPQFRFYRASDLPIYATSLIYGGSPDPELNGVRFCDMPWMLQADDGYAGLRAEAAELPALKSQPRLYALGYDAYTLVSLIQSGQLQSGGSYPAASGELSVSGNGLIGRRLECAQVDNGQPRLLEP